MLRPSKGRRNLILRCSDGALVLQGNGCEDVLYELNGSLGKLPATVPQTTYVTYKALNQSMQKDNLYVQLKALLNYLRGKHSKPNHRDSKLRRVKHQLLIQAVQQQMQSKDLPIISDLLSKLPSGTRACCILPILNTEPDLFLRRSTRLGSFGTPWGLDVGNAVCCALFRRTGFTVSGFGNSPRNFHRL